jgi:hypothetical protein
MQAPIAHPHSEDVSTKTLGGSALAGSVPPVEGVRLRNEDVAHPA